MADINELKNRYNINAEEEDIKPINIDDDLGADYMIGRQQYHNDRTPLKRALKMDTAAQQESPKLIRQESTTGGDIPLISEELKQKKQQRVQEQQRKVKRFYDFTESERRSKALAALSDPSKPWEREAIEHEFGRKGQGATDPGLYDPIDLIVDALSVGTTAAGRAGVKLFFRGIGRTGKTIAKKGAGVVGKEILEAGATTGAGLALKEGAKLTGKNLLREMGFGALSAGMMGLAMEAGAGPLVQMMAGIVGPTVTQSILLMTRRSAARYMSKLAQNNKKVYDELIEAIDSAPKSEFGDILKSKVEEIKEIKKAGRKPKKMTSAEIEQSEIENLLKEVKILESSILPENGMMNQNRYDILGKKYGEEAGTKLVGTKEPIIREKTLSEKIHERDLAHEYGFDPKRVPTLETPNDLDLPVTPHYINFDNVDTTDDAIAALKKTSEMYAKDIGEARRGKQSNAETKKLASTLGMSVEDLLKRRRGQAFNAEEALGARYLLVTSAEKLMELAKQAKAHNFDGKYLYAFKQKNNVTSEIAKSRMLPKEI